MIGALVTPALYRGLSSFAAPVIYFWLAQRRGQGKEDKTRFPERLGHASLARPDGRLAWVHAASVGESLAVLPLAERLRAKGLSVLITSGTVSSAQVLEKRLGDSMIHQYVPIDRPTTVKRFLDYWRPDVAIWVESELWPNLVLAAADRHIPMVMVNARMSERSARRWRHMPHLIKPLLEAFNSCLAQSEEDAARLRSLGAATTELTGNIKFDAPPLPANDKALNDLKQEVGGRPHWLMASSHPGDEDAAAKAHSILVSDNPGLLTLIAPRHPERGDAVVAMLRRRGLQVAERSAGEHIAPETDIYVSDTLGEMGLLYRTSEITFIAGSLTDHGGHNPVEPALLGNALLAGPDMRNFDDACRALEKADALTRIARADDLADALAPLLLDAALTRKRAVAARATARALGGASDEALAEIIHLLGDVSEAAHARA